MKTATLVLVVLLAGCATGESYRTTVEGQSGGKVTYEAKRTGYWIAKEIKPLVPEKDELSMGDNGSSNVRVGSGR